MSAKSKDFLQINVTLFYDTSNIHKNKIYYDFRICQEIVLLKYFSFPSSTSILSHSNILTKNSLQETGFLQPIHTCLNYSNMFVWK